MEDDLYVSTLLRTTSGGRFMEAISNTEILINSTLALCNHEEYTVGMEAIRKLKHKSHLQHPNLSLWPSAFSGIGVIVNRATPAHRDRGSSAAVFDLLASMGTHMSARIGLPDLQADLSYGPGTIVLVCGRVLRHEVLMWEGGERICLAHYMRDNVHNRLGLQRPDWVTLNVYNSLMDQGYRSRQGL